MSSFTAELRVAGQRYPVVQFHLAFTQATDQRGRVSAKVRHGQLELELDVPQQDHLLAWAAEAHKTLPGTLVIFDMVGQPQEYISFTTAYCVAYHELFQAGDGQRGAYRCTIHLTDPAGFTIGAGAVPGGFTAPPARTHGRPPQPLASTPVAALSGGPISTCPPAETARLQAQVEMLCKVGKSKCIDTDTCPTLTGKMAALQACITARETIMNRCFGGGDAGHQNEVQAMCQRVAMLKLGQVVALDTMSQLIRRISGSQLIVHLSQGDLPDDLRHLVVHDERANGNGAGKKYTLRVTEYGEVEQILARLRLGGATIDEMQLQQADLEDIFLQIMDGGSL